jgi:hypothetical protein
MKRTQKKRLRKPASLVPITTGSNLAMNPSESAFDKAIRDASPLVFGEMQTVVDRVVCQSAGAGMATDPHSEDSPVRADCVLARTLGILHELNPQNATETLLAGQIIAVNEAAHVWLQRGMRPQDPESAEQQMTVAMRLMRLFLQQIETMHRLKGNTGQQRVTEQRVTVEHVHVNQAIVGVVPPSEGGGK